MLATLARIPSEGDKATIGDWVFEVVDMDGRRIDKVLVVKKPGAPTATDVNVTTR